MKGGTMDQEEADIALIERRINGELSEAELKAFDARVAADLRFAEKVDDYVAIITGIKNFDAYAISEEVEQWEKEIRDEEHAVPVRSISPPWKKYMAVAAAVALLVVSFIIINRPGAVDERQLFASYFAPYEDVLSVRDGDRGAASLETAMALYTRQSYSDAIPHFRTYLAAQPQDQDALFYLGISYLAEGNATDALDVLGELNRQTSAYGDHVEWYLALAHLLNQEVPAAKTILAEIQNEPEHDFSGKAGELLKALD